MSRLLLTTDAVGGVWHYSVELLRRLGRPVTLAVLGPSPSPAQRAELDALRLPGLEVLDTALPLDWTAPDPASLQAGAASLRRSAEVLAALAAREGVAALVGDAPWGVPVLAVAHSDLATWWAAMRPGLPVPADFAWRIDATARGLARADSVVAPTQAMAAALHRAYPAVSFDVCAIHNASDAPLRPIGSRPRAVLAAGRLWDEAKGMDVLDAAVSLLGVDERSRGLQPARALAAGPLRGPLGQSASLQHLSPLGNLDQPALWAAMAGAAVFAAPARYEPFGLAVLEAARAGLALVLSDIAPLRELWDGAALFVPPGDPLVLARALGRALDDPRPLARAAQARSRRFAPQAFARATAALHDALLLRGRLPPAMPRRPGGGCAGEAVLSLPASGAIPGAAAPIQAGQRLAKGAA